jgi:hypothetical protein
MMGYRGRDVEVVMINEKQCIVTACDSCGAIGSKELDVVKVPPYITGRFTMRGTLLEVISTGAVPKVVTVAISNEPFPTGEGILDGVYEELKELKLEGLPVAISTEKNMKTSQTAVGITVVGICDREELRIGMSRSGDLLYCVGIPKVGEAMEADDSEIVQGKHILELLNVEGVHDIVPVGSRGIQREIETLCSNIEYKFTLEPNTDINITKSAGPSTCAIFTCTPDTELSGLKLAPLVKLGKLV